MAYRISDACVNCGICESECPVGAISEANGTHVIDAGACISCGACAGVCPSQAIAEDQLTVEPALQQVLSNRFERDDP